MGKTGDAVVIEITRYPDAARREIAGKLLKVLGDPDDPRTEIEKILACAVIPLEFPDEATQQAINTAQELQPGDLANRIDLRDRRFATIDPETARDFDDALCIEDGPHGTACGSPSPMSRTTCGGVMRSTRRPRSAASPCISRIA